MDRTLVLASTSSYRRELLSHLKIPFVAASPEYQEEHDLAVPPPELVLTLAHRKAQSLRGHYTNALILAADQVAEIDGQILNKPHDLERAFKQLQLLRGRTHRLLTGVVVLDTESQRMEQALDIQTLKMRAVSDEQLREYLEREQPFDCAGAYRIEGSGASLFESLSNNDTSAIIGLPLAVVVELLGRFGYVLSARGDYV
jgi:septum formation protein